MAPRDYECACMRSVTVSMNVMRSGSALTRYVLYKYMYMYTYVYTCAYIYIYIDMYTVSCRFHWGALQLRQVWLDLQLEHGLAYNIYIYIYTHVYTYVYIYIYRYIDWYVYIHVYMYIYIYIYIYLIVLCVVKCHMHVVCVHCLSLRVFKSWIVSCLQGFVTLCPRASITRGSIHRERVACIYLSLSLFLSLSLYIYIHIYIYICTYIYIYICIIML